MPPAKAPWWTDSWPKSLAAKPAILNRGRIVAAHRGCWPRLRAGDRRYLRLRLQGRPARAADPHGKRTHPWLDVGPIYRPYPPRPRLRAADPHGKRTHPWLDVGPIY